MVRTNNPDRKDGPLLARWQARTQKVLNEAYALSYAFRDPRTPWYARAWLGLVVAYAFSPIDLIPDFIPVIGYIDDLLLVPLGIAVALKLVPPEVMASAREQARSSAEGGRPVNRLGAVLVLLIWLGVLILGGILVLRFLSRRGG